MLLNYSHIYDNFDKDFQITIDKVTNIDLFYINKYSFQENSIIKKRELQKIDQIFLETRSMLDNKRPIIKQRIYALFNNQKVYIDDLGLANCGEQYIYDEDNNKWSCALDKNNNCFVLISNEELEKEENLQEINFPFKFQHNFSSFHNNNNSIIYDDENFYFYTIEKETEHYENNYNEEDSLDEEEYQNFSRGNIINNQILLLRQSMDVSLKAPISKENKDNKPIKHKLIIKKNELLNKKNKEVNKKNFIQQEIQKEKKEKKEIQEEKDINQEIDMLEELVEINFDIKSNKKFLKFYENYKKNVNLETAQTVLPIKKIEEVDDQKVLEVINQHKQVIKAPDENIMRQNGIQNLVMQKLFEQREKELKASNKK